MRNFKSSNLQDKNTVIFALFTAMFFVSALVGIYSAIRVEFFNAGDNIESIATIFIFLTIIAGAIMIMYGFKKNIRLRSPKPGETIKIIFKEHIADGNNNSEDGRRSKTFYLYSIKDTIYADERKISLLEVDEKYFVNKDGELEFKIEK